MFDFFNYILYCLEHTALNKLIAGVLLAGLVICLSIALALTLLKARRAGTSMWAAFKEFVVTYF